MGPELRKAIAFLGRAQADRLNRLVRDPGNIIQIRLGDLEVPREQIEECQDALKTVTEKQFDYSAPLPHRWSLYIEVATAQPHDRVDFRLIGDLPDRVKEFMKRLMGSKRRESRFTAARMCASEGTGSDLPVSARNATFARFDKLSVTKR